MQQPDIEPLTTQFRGDATITSVPAPEFNGGAAAYTQPEQAAPAPLKVTLPVPRPLAGEYRWNRLLALVTSPKRLYNFIKYTFRKKTTTVNYLPVQLDIEPVSRCNFHCTMCQVSDWPKYQRAADMSFEDFKSIIDSQYGLLEIKLQGYGEPLLARDTLFKMIRYARERHIWVRTTTNASLLHLNDNYKKFIDSGINEIQISFDGATKQTFESIRRGSVFERVVENCTLINEYSRSKGLLRTRMWSTLQATNVREFFQFLTLAQEMGFARMTYSLNLHGFGQDKWINDNQRSNLVDQVTKEMAEEAMQRGAELGIDVTFWKATEKYSTESIDRLCAWPFERVFISSDMRIVPCCVISNPNTADLGDARNFKELWNGTTFQESRSAHLEGRIPDYCRECYEETGSCRSTLAIVK